MSGLVLVTETGSELGTWDPAPLPCAGGFVYHSRADRHAKLRGGARQGAFKDESKTSQ